MPSTFPCTAADKLCMTALSKLLLILNYFYFCRGQVEWDAFEWIHVECFPNLIQLACLLPQKEDNLRSRISKVTCLTFEVL